MIVHVEYFAQEAGHFGPWSWELHRMLGVHWFWMAGTRFERALFPGRFSPLWLIFYAQYKGERA